jgi:pyruvate/2-oxoglutarate dehydrogenase complex dihydrolipoamide acyltransferase (E2) component
MTPVVLAEEAWDGVDEAALTNWFFDDGDRVSEGDLICEITVVKAAVEVRAPASGVLKILVPADAVVSKGERLAEIA